MDKLSSNYMKTYIWSLPTRIFHWLLVVGFSAAYLLRENDELRSWHLAFGALAGALILFRIIYGFIGTPYSKFSDFPMGFRHLKEEIKNFFFSKNMKISAGHNPLASVVMLILLVVGLCCCIIGFLLYASQNELFTIGIGAGTLKELHENAANLFLFAVILHLIGLLVDTIKQGSNAMIFSMFSGYKHIGEESIKMNKMQKIFSLFWIIVPIILFFAAYKLPVKKETNEKEHQTEQNKLIDTDDD